jgi:dienelactone hydrolase
MTRFGDLPISREPLNDYGSLEETMRRIRAHRRLDLSAERWRAEHPEDGFEDWRRQARACLLEGLHYDPGPLDLRSEVVGSEKRDGLIVERVAFNTTPWNRLDGYFLRPADAAGPLPGLVVFHAWGGPMLFGCDRIVNSGRDHPLLAEHRDTYYSGRYLAEVFAGAGYAVIVVDAWHFGERAPRGLDDAGIPDRYDPYELSVEAYQQLDTRVRDALYLGVRQLNWAGTTWMGLNFWDDARCVDYLRARPEVDGERIGCTGLSGGGWRTNVLAALDERIGASVSVGWMTTGDHQQVYNVSGAIGTFCLLPGVWNRLDVPDLIAMSAPAASMVVSGQQDDLFTPEGQGEAARQIQAAYEWAGCPERFGDYRPDKPHCYDAEVQAEALTWLDRHLK